MEPGLLADRPLCLTADRERLVEVGDPEAAFVLVARAGKEIPAAEVARLGLELVDGRIQQAAVDEVERESSEEDPKPRRRRTRPKE